jgi:hypothetical protein
MNAVTAMSCEFTPREAPIDYIEVDDSPPAPTDSHPRDRRAVNRLNPELQDTHNALVNWAREKGEDRTGTEWHRKTLLGRVIEFGPDGLAHGTSGPTAVSEDYMATDAAVAHLGEIDRRIIWAYYVDWHKARDGSWWRLARMSEKKAGHVLNRARWRVKGYIAGWYRRK